MYDTAWQVVNVKKEFMQKRFNLFQTLKSHLHAIGFWLKSKYANEMDKYQDSSHKN